MSMNKKVQRAMTTPATVTAGAATDVSDLLSCVVALVGSFTGTYQLQISLDGTNFVDTGSALTAAGSVDVPDAAMKVRWNCTAHSAGTPSSAVGGVKDISAVW